MTDDNTPTESTAAGTAATPPNHDDALLDGLDEYTAPLETTDPVAPLDDVAQLHDHLADARIVGLGEATHGTREFFQLKHRLLRYLVTELDCRAFALEANFSEALALDDYVVHGEGDPREALDAVYFWTWQVESVLALVEWLREFNAERSLEDRVRFYGVDAQYTQGAVDALREFFAVVDPEFLATVREDLDAAADDGRPPHQDDDCGARVEAADRVVPQLRERLDEQGAAYAAQTSDDAVGMARQHVRVLEQAAGYKQGFIEHADEGPDDETVAARLEQRDRAMADNLDWVLGRTDTERVVVWAHDAHLNRIRQPAGNLDATAPSLGSVLADRHGEDYYAVGFAFGSGAFQALSEDSDADDNSNYSLREQTLDGPLPDTVDATLVELGHAVALTDLRRAGGDDRLADWLGRPQPTFSTGATYDPEAPEEHVTEYVFADAFDALCYVDETTRARPLTEE